MNLPGRGPPGPGAPLPPCVVVHGWDQACLVVHAAQEVGTAVALLSAPGAAAYAGIGWWRALADGVARTTGTAPTDVLDCGTMPGLAVQALRSGCRALVLHPGVPAWADIAYRAAVVGGVLLAVRPAALDLLRPGAVRELPAWLRAAAYGDSTPPVG